MLVDTSGFLSLLHRDEAEHQSAVDHYRSAAFRLTHNYILDEFVPLARRRGFPHLATAKFSRQVLVDPRVEVVWVDRTLHVAALDLLDKRPDKSYSLCDAVSFILMRERGIASALTTDRHFEQEGFNRLLA